MLALGPKTKAKAKKVPTAMAKAMAKAKAKAMVTVPVEGSLLQVALQMSQSASLAVDDEVQPRQGQPMIKTYERVPASKSDGAVLIGVVEVWERRNAFPAGGASPAGGAFPAGGASPSRFFAVQRPSSWFGPLGGIWRLCKWVETWSLSMRPPTAPGDAAASDDVV